MNIKICAFDKERYENVIHGRNSMLKDSWIELASTAKFECDDNCEIFNAKITIKDGASLKIGKSCRIQGPIIVENNSSVSIGHGLVCNFEIKIQSNGGGAIFIGNDCLFSNAEIYNSDMHAIYDMESGSRMNASRDVHIGDRVWLSQDVLVLKGSRISQDTVVGARSLVSGSHPGNVILVGNPAKVVRSGVRWSREELKTMPANFFESFSAGEFKAAAVLLQHEKVINWGLPLITQYERCDASNDFIFYYTARSIYETRFNENLADVEMGSMTISLRLLRDVFNHVYRSGKCRNHACGSYVYVASYRLGDIDEAVALYDQIFKMWPAIEKKKMHR